ncbi:hypothetical protein [Metasolibacillus meyeri]|uniref:hypothetical protein n=1 Tax=Metasolibacillus meyeri TaxID=1071052 RepID=UPI00128FE47D|nr:hypothetical protein [Metasolibacillus meyeri]
MSKSANFYQNERAVGEMREHPDSNLVRKVQDINLYDGVHRIVIDGRQILVAKVGKSLVINTDRSLITHVD